jgi:hypothetical protein
MGIPIKTENVSFAYLAVINKLMYVGEMDWGYLLILTKDIFANKSILAFGRSDHTIAWDLVGRLQDAFNFYRATIWISDPSSDFWISKFVAGSETNIAAEAVNLPSRPRFVLFSLNGSTLKASRYEPLSTPIDPFNLPTPTATISAIDTTFTSGRFGMYSNFGNMAMDIGATYLLPPMSPSPQVIAIYEVEITGDGSRDNPFKPNLPQKLEVVDKAELDKYPPDLQQAILLNKEQKVDRLALSWSAFIPTDENGIPLHKTCLVFIFEQPNRQSHLYPIQECLDEIEKIPTVKKHDKKTAKEEMFKRDKKLEKERAKKEKEVDEFLGI